MSGWKSLSNISRAQIHFLTNNEIICLAETWLTSPNVYLPKFLCDYDIFSSCAVREKSRGRASGGLVTLVRKRKSIQAKILDSSNLWLFITVTIGEEKFIIGNVYLPPSVSDDFCIESLGDFLINLMENKPENVKLILTGDFNARIGNFNNMTDFYMSDFSFLNSNRSSNDQIVNKRGRMLVELMEENNLLVCNGRTISDTPASYTFIAEQGCSTIDLIWIGEGVIRSVRDMFTRVIVEGAHLIITLEIVSNQLVYEPNLDLKNDVTIIKYDENKIIDFYNTLSLSQNLYFNSTSSDSLYNNFTDAISSSSDQSGYRIMKQISLKTNDKFIPKNPWFDTNCRNLQKETRRAYRKYKNSYNDKSLLQNYLTTRKKYNNLIIQTKETYHKTILNKLSNIKNNKDFWEIVRSFNNNKQFINEVSLDAWIIFYQNIYPKRQNLALNFFSVFHPYLDADFSLQELQKTIKKCKINKAPGRDKITNNILKNLPPTWEHYLLHLFNTVMDTETIPIGWSIIEMCMLYKKGEKTDPYNYRGIALVNTVTKIFTTLIAKRLVDWAEANSLIPEEQAGFRPKRGCQDHLFTLASITNLHVGTKKSCMYVIFVDFKRAFDSVNHQLLWNKLFKLGVSGKIIRILKNFYDIARLTVRCGEGCSGLIDVTEGVLQGDSLSPLLFILMLSDIVDYFREKGMQGLPISSVDDLIMLLYADDIALLAYSWHDAQNKLKVLEEYCKDNGLILNAKKTKVLPIRKTGGCRRLKTLFWEKEPLEYVNSYIYLGVPFSTSGKFAVSAEYFKNRGIAASAKLRNLLYKSKNESWDVVRTLFCSTVNSVVLYDAETWALRYLDEIDTVQSKFIKSLYYWPKNTPTSLVLLETGSLPIRLEVIKRVLRWWSRILKMSNDRLPKKCYNRMYELDKSNKLSFQYSWVSQIRALFEQVGLLHLWLNQGAGNSKYIQETSNLMLTAWENNLKSLIIQKCINSKYSPTYRHISQLNTIEKYLTFKIPIHKTRVISQLRVANVKRIKISFHGNNYILNTFEICSLCNLNELESMSHFLLYCPIYTPSRNKFLKEYIPCNPALDETQALQNILCINSTKQLNDVYNFTCNALKIRSFIINE